MQSLVKYILSVLIIATNLFADGFIVIPRPNPLPNPFPLEVVYHKVDVKIDGQSAVTKIDQSFYNPSLTINLKDFIFSRFQKEQS